MVAHVRGVLLFSIAAVGACTSGSAVEERQAARDGWSFLDGAAQRDAAVPHDRDGAVGADLNPDGSSDRDSRIDVAPPPVGFVVQRVHIARDLLPHQCNFGAPFSLTCRWASLLACQALGFVGGSGPVEFSKSVADVLCVGAAAGVYREFPYDAGCSSGNVESVYCDSLARRSCISAGFASSIGVVGANATMIATVCLNAGADLVELNATEQAVEAASGAGYCQTGQLGTTNRCQHNVHRHCRQQGYDMGFGPLEYSDGNTVLACARGQADNGGLTPATLFDGFERPAQLGINVLGGPAFAAPLIYADGLYNAFSQPILVRRMELFSDYVAPPGGAYSKDMCFFLNRAAIWQFDDNDDGELACVYSDGKNVPSLDFLDRGIVIGPGERLSFQATPQWDGSGHEHNAWTHVTISAASSGGIPVRRARFPKWDTGYLVNDTLTVPAGTMGTALIPASVPPGKPLESSNWWYPVPQATAVRGISVFMSNGQPAGLQKVDACVRVVAQGGVNLTPPECLTVQADLFTPASYPGGSAFFPLNITVPAGALVGVDFTLSTATPAGLDFAGYVWLEQ